MYSKFLCSLICGLIIAIAGCRGDLPAPGKAAEPPASGKIEMYYFYDGSCEACNKVKEFYEILDEELEGVNDLYPYTVISCNVFSTDGIKIKTEFFQNLGMDEVSIKSLSAPILVINGNIYQGTDQVRRNVRNAYLAAGETLENIKGTESKPSKQ